MVKQENGVFYVSGSIKADTAAQFREELAEAFGQESVTLDFAGVNYISSAGLRVLLELKKSGSKVKIINVSRDVFDVFEITGFDNLLDVEKALKEISVEGLRCIGTGATGSAYRLDDERIIKLFNERMDKARVAAEQNTAREAFVMGVPTCIPFEIVKDGNCYGIIYELVHSSTLDELFAKADEEEEDRLIQKYVSLIKTACSIRYKDTSRAMDIKKVMIQVSAYLKAFFTEEELNKGLKLFQHMKESDTFVHADAHPGNVMVQDDELIYIDMTTSGYGDPFWDLVAFASHYSLNALILTEETFEKKYGINREKARAICRKVFTCYYEGESEEQIAFLEKLATGTAAFRALLGELHNPNRDPAVIDQMKKLVLDAAEMLE